MSDYVILKTRDEVLSKIFEETGVERDVDGGYPSRDELVKLLDAVVKLKAAQK